MNGFKKVKEKEKQELIANQKSRYRQLLHVIIQNPPKNIVIYDWDCRGDIQFSIVMKDLGLEYSDYQKYKDEFFSYFMIDFIGELIIRDNLSLFAKKLQEYDINDYMSIMERYGEDHKRFGVKTDRGQLIFKFHASFLKNILTENLRETLG